MRFYHHIIVSCHSRVYSAATANVRSHYIRLSHHRSTFTHTNQKRRWRRDEVVVIIWNIERVHETTSSRFNSSPFGREIHHSLHYSHHPLLLDYKFPILFRVSPINQLSAPGDTIRPCTERLMILHTRKQGLSTDEQSVMGCSGWGAKPRAGTWLLTNKNERTGASTSLALGQEAAVQGERQRTISDHLAELYKSWWVKILSRDGYTHQHQPGQGLSSQLLCLSWTAQEVM